ncbi:Gfo/Idh/MocA family oxidoreductase [Alphaproteobacteria bacterium]|nr:Gfo/Idh/MocA family oxidoreductase [Alphaproteobacteria bacterium]
MTLEENCSINPEHVAVIGGGRWARVLLEVFCDIVPPFVQISVHSPRNSQSMLAWVSARGLDGRIQVSSIYPEVTAGKSYAVIVVNAARDHEKAIEWALSRCLPVLVEKPVTLSFAATQRLTDLAISQKTYLAAAHVFLFSSYVRAFSKLVNEAGGLRAIRVRWMDPVAESRYGEAKSYDPGLTIYADLLPHILSILTALSANSFQPGRKLEVLRGGAYLKMDIQIGDIPCEVEMVRNGDCRQRLIEVDTGEGMKSLDFAKEPGVIFSDAMEQCVDPVWNIEPRPLASMLRAFLQGAVGGPRNKGLDIGIGLVSSQIIDHLSPTYESALSAWLEKKCAVLGKRVDADLRYTLSEILCVEDPLSSVPIEQRTEYVFEHLKIALMSPLRAKYESRPVGLVRHIVSRGKSTSYEKRVTNTC